MYSWKNAIPDAPQELDLHTALRKLGYLEAHVHHFLGRGGDGIGGALRAALRVAAIAGPLLALTLFTFHMVADPLLLTSGGRAAVLLAVLLLGETTLLAGFSLALNLLALRGFSWRRRENLTWLAAALLVLYLGVCWWHVRRTVEPGWSRTIGDMAVLALGAALL